ncbi:MAG: NAD-dependent deacylase [Aquificota bacterium]|nr:NAD-dependent deacylase [Aquificota bacterium]
MLVALTGAGISAESGVPTFRGEEGLWKRYDPSRLATPEAFQRDPKTVWEWYAWRREVIAKAEPNEAHRTLADLEREKGLWVITQNVDGLHQRAGSKKVIELHGNIWRVRCLSCGARFYDRRVPLKEIPPRCGKCGGLLRPDVVWFGEPLPEDALRKAYDLSARAEVFLVIGTSATVYPAAELPLIAKRSGAKVIEINPEETPLTPFADLSIRKGASEGLREVVGDLI